VNDRIKNQISEKSAHLLLNLPAKDGSFFDKGQQQAKHIQGAGWESPSDNPYGFEQSFQAFESIVMHLHGDNDIRAGHKCIERQVAEGRGTVNNTKGISAV
jgi:hypothetical protein